MVASKRKSSKIQRTSFSRPGQGLTKQPDYKQLGVNASLNKPFGVASFASDDVRYRSEYGYMSWDADVITKQAPSDLDDWAELVWNSIPKTAEAVMTICFMASGFDFSISDPSSKAAIAAQNLLYSPTCMLKPHIIDAMICWHKYGRLFVDLGGGKPPALKVLNPRTMTVIRDNADDIAKLADVPGQVGAKNAKPDQTGKILGYIQAGQGISDVKKFLAPARVMFIPRFPQPDSPNGVSVFRNMYRTLTNELGVEDTLAKATRRHGDPQRLVKIGNATNPCYPDVGGQAMIDFVKTRVSEAEGGQDIFIPDWVDMALMQSQMRGIPELVMAFQKQTETNSTIGAGTFPALMAAEGFRASADQAVRMLEFRINGIRDVFESYYFTYIVRPYFQSSLGKDAVIPWKWRDITPDDTHNMIQALSAAVQSMWMEPNDARGFVNIPLWDAKKNDSVVATKQQTVPSTRPDRLEKPSPNLKNRVPTTGDQAE